MKKNSCYGCVSYLNSIEICFSVIEPIHNGIECPCVKCLIKGVCNSKCDKFNQYLSISYYDSDIN